MIDTREHIIKVACRLFLQNSFKEVTLNELVRNTGLSKGAFYHYFESKEQLFLAVLDFFFSSVMIHHYENYSRESFYKFYHDYADEIKSFGQQSILNSLGNESEEEFNMNYFTMAIDALKLFPEYRSKMAEEQKNELGIWSEMIKMARKNGEIQSAMSDEEIARIFMYLSDGVAMHLIMEGVKLEEMISPFLSLWDKLYEQMKV
jgi:AcrR family transcriptional regulator